MTHDLLLFLTTFLASAVEAVEALTIVLAVGVVRGWRSPLIGVGAAAVVLGGIVAVLGPALSRIPINTLRFVVGALLLVFGLQWLRKAILRAGGYKALHDEGAAFARERADAAAAPAEPRGAWTGTRSPSPSRAYCSRARSHVHRRHVRQHAGQARVRRCGRRRSGVLVVLVGLLVRGPLERVPENTLKFGVGRAVTSFGIFWGGEGAGVEWPGEDLAILGIVAFLATRVLRCSSRPLRRSARRPLPERPAREVRSRVRALLVGLRHRRRLARRSWCRRRARYHRFPDTSGTRRLVGASRDSRPRADDVATTI